MSPCFRGWIDENRLRDGEFFAYLVFLGFPLKPTSEQLNSLLDGKFDSQIAEYHVIDCRFDYEYAGGHIPGAININTTTEIEEFFLGSRRPSSSPSCSGDGVKKTVLVFHCEFSAKRAPTL